MSTILLEAGDRGAVEFLRLITGLDAQNLAVPLRALAVVTVLSVVPSIILLATSFPRILIILSFLRRALGTQDLPPGQVVAGLSLLLTAIVMGPTWRRVYTEAYLPLERGEIQGAEAVLEKASRPLKEFMLSHTFEDDLRLFSEIYRSSSVRGGEAKGTEEKTGGGGTAETSVGRSAEEENFLVVLSAFVVSELKVAFQIGFLLYLPFLVIDLAASAVLISMGMFMLPPMLVSLPLKVLVFVLADGWTLVVEQLVAGFHYPG